MRNLLFGRLGCFATENDGAVMLETIIVTPVILILLAGILEFGALLFYKIEFETGLRDAARYLARCHDVSYHCDETIAKYIAVYGTPANPSERVRDWREADVQITRRSINNPIDSGTGLPLYNGDDPIYVVRVSSDFTYRGGPLLGLLGFASIPMRAFHEERVIGW